MNVQRLLISLKVNSLTFEYSSSCFRLVHLEIILLFNLQSKKSLSLQVQIFFVVTSRGIGSGGMFFLV